MQIKTKPLMFLAILILSGCATNKPHGAIGCAPIALLEHITDEEQLQIPPHVRVKAAKNILNLMDEADNSCLRIKLHDEAL